MHNYKTSKINKSFPKSPKATDPGMPVPCREQLCTACPSLGGYPFFWFSIELSSPKCFDTSSASWIALAVGLQVLCTIPDQRGSIQQEKFQKTDLQPPLIFKIKGQTLPQEEMETEQKGKIQGHGNEKKPPLMELSQGLSQVKNKEVHNETPWKDSEH